MEISIATSRPASQQSNSVRSLVPSHLREGAESFMGFMEDYYAYINQHGLPSHEISSITSEHDIDRTSAQYIDLIQKEIAKNVPEAKAFDRVSLYKKIVKYYLTKGSEDSIINFFKIFYDETIAITYPRERLFKTSAGVWDEANEKHRNTKGFLSNTDVLQDSHFWQDFSYVIETSLPVYEWRNEFLNLVHPAGFKFFGVLVLLLIRREKKWIGRYIKYDSEKREYIIEGLPHTYSDPYNTYEPTDLDWMKSLTPPSRAADYIDGYGDQGGDHTPLFQFGLMSRDVLRTICTLAQTDDETFKRFVILTIEYWTDPNCDIFIRTRNDYIQNLKFLDSDGISEFMDTTIEFGRQFSCNDVKYPTIEHLEGKNINNQSEYRTDILDKALSEQLLIMVDEGYLVENHNNRRLFSNISAFIDISRDSYLVAEDTDPDSPSYDGDIIVTSDGDNIGILI